MRGHIPFRSITIHELMTHNLYTDVKKLIFNMNLYSFILNKDDMYTWAGHQCIIGNIEDAPLPAFHNTRKIACGISKIYICTCRYLTCIINCSCTCWLWMVQLYHTLCSTVHSYMYMMISKDWNIWNTFCTYNGI